MAGTIDDGGAAFPSPWQDGVVGTDGQQMPAQFGMSLRDWFAGQAMALCADSIRRNYKQGGEVFSLCREGDSDADFVAVDAYALADAMLAARKRGDA